MSNRLYDIINTFNNLVAKDEPKKQLTESAVAKPKSKLEETMAKIEAEFQTFKEAKKAKPDFLDVDKDGNKKETFKKAVKDKQVKEAAKPDFLDLDKDGNKKEPMKKAAKDKKPDYSKSLQNQFGGSADELTKNLTIKKKTNEAGRELVSGQKLGIQGSLTPFYYNAIAKYLRANGLESVEQFSSEDLDVLSSKLGTSMDALADLVGFNEVTEDTNNKELADQIAQLLAKGNKVDSRVAGAMGHIVRAEGTHITLAKLNKPTSKIRYSWLLTPQRAEQLEIVKAGPNHFVVRDTDEAWGDTQKSLGLETPSESLDEVSAPGQESWIKKNKARFIDQYGKKKGMEVLYATAWKRSKKNESIAGDSDDTTAIAQALDEVLNQGVGYIKAVMTVAKQFGTHPEYVVQAYEQWGGFEHDDAFDTFDDLYDIDDGFDESAHDSEISEEDPVFEAKDEDGDEYGWDVPEKKTKTASSRKVAGKAYGGAAQKDDDEEETNGKPAGEKRGRGRPKGSGKKMGSKGPSGKSKLMKDSVTEVFADRGTGTSGTSKEDRRIAKLHQQKHMKKKHTPVQDKSKKSVAKGSINEAADNLGEIAEDLQHVVDRLTDIGEHDLAKQLQPIVWDLDDRDPAESLGESDYGWDYPEEKSKAPTSRKVAGTRYGGAAQKDDDKETTAATPEKRGRGRPKGTGKKMGAQGPTGKSKLMKESRPSLMDRLLAETYASFNEDSDLTIDQDQLRQHIGDANFEQLRRAIQVTGTYPEEMYDTLYDYFSETGEMPYGAATAEDEDPYNWIHQKLDQMFGDEVGYDQENIDIDMGEPDEDEMNAESVNESKDMIAESLSRILHSYPYEVKTFLAGGDMDKDLYSALFDYYNDQGELPYQVKAGNDTVEWIADKFGTDLRNVELEEDGPKMSDVPAYLRKAQGKNFPLSRDQITPTEKHLWVVPGPGSRDFEPRAFPNTPQGKMAADEFAYGVKGKVVVSAESPVVEETDSLGAELNELARLAGLKESIRECGEMSPFTQSGGPEQPSGMSINTNIDTRTGTKTMTVTADGDVADKLAEILSLSGLAAQVSTRSSEVVGQDVEQEPEMQVVAVGEAKDEDREKFHASTTPDPKVASVDAIIDQGDDLNRKKKQHADKPKLGDNPMATENISLSKSAMRELESIKIKK